MILFFTSYKTHIQFFSAFPHLFKVVFTNGGYECLLVSKNTTGNLLFLYWILNLVKPSNYTYIDKKKPLLNSALGELNEDIVTLQPLRYHHNQKIIPDPPVGYNDKVFGRIIAVILKVINLLFIVIIIIFIGIRTCHRC